MFIRFWNAFVKITGWLVQSLCFRTEVLYEDPSAQGRRVKGAAIIISNHTSVYDLPLYMFVFFSRTLRFQIAELQFEKKPLGWLLRRLGGIRVDRNAHDFGFIAQSQDILRSGGVVAIFPEGRLPKEGEETPLEFKPSAAFLALCSGVPVIPVYTNGSYFSKNRARVVIGKPIYAGDLTNDALTDKENYSRVSAALREKVISLGRLLQNGEAQKKRKLFSLEYLVYDFVKLTAAPGVLWFRPKLLYAGERAKKKIKGGALVISNHIGFFDPVYLQFCVWYRRHHFICTDDFFKSGAQWWFKRFLCIPIDRENTSLDSFRQITAHLKNGELVSMFPEGRVETKQGQTASFKSGMVLMALKSGVPIVPVYIKKKPHALSRLVMAVGEPVDVTALYGKKPTFSQIEAATRLLWQKEEELKNTVEQKGR